jgi:hypothetical protein
MFNYLNSILYKNKADIQNLNEDAEFQPFLMQRWCTMHSTEVTTLVNETTNRYWSVLDDKKTWYAALDTVIPRCKFKKIAYLKKTKKDLDGKEREYIQKIANSLEISSRELINYIKENDLEIKLSKNND